MKTIKEFFINITIPKLIVLILVSFTIKFVIDYGLRDFLVPFFMIFSLHTEEAFRFLAAHEMINKILATIEIATLVMLAYIFKLTFTKKATVQDIVKNKVSNTDSVNKTSQTNI